uniref:Uncharacterized protein n=1 Tax=Equus asinus TaxID=9793 RepID=A0A9L0JXV0_EQUAS
MQPPRGLGFEAEMPPRASCVCSVPPDLEPWTRCRSWRGPGGDAHQPGRVCSLTSVIRSNTAQVWEENIRLLKTKVMQMRGICGNVDQPEAFVRMRGHHVSFLEAHVLQAGWDHRAFLQALRRWPGPPGAPSFWTNRLCHRPRRTSRPCCTCGLRVGLGRARLVPRAA